MISQYLVSHTEIIMGSSPGQVKPNTVKLVFAASAWSIQEYSGVIAKTLAQKEENLPEQNVECCFSEPAL
jgi:hypothetical protein